MDQIFSARTNNSKVFTHYAIIPGTFQQRRHRAAATATAGTRVHGTRAGARAPRCSRTPRTPHTPRTRMRWTTLGHRRLLILLILCKLVRHM